VNYRKRAICHLSVFFGFYFYFLVAHGSILFVRMSDDKNSPIPGFLRKAFEIFSTPEFSDMCGWNAAGDSVVIKKVLCYEQYVNFMFAYFFLYGRYDPRSSSSPRWCFQSSLNMQIFSPSSGSLIWFGPLYCLVIAGR
jgi:hypothetical protein